MTFSRTFTALPASSPQLSAPASSTHSGGDRGAAEDHVVLVAQALGHEDVDELLLGRHRGGHERRGADDVGAHLLGAAHEVERVRRRVPRSWTSKPAALQHGDGDVLADLVHVALHGADDDDAALLPSAAPDSSSARLRARPSRSCMARAASISSGRKISPRAEAVADLAHAGAQPRPPAPRRRRPHRGRVAARSAACAAVPVLYRQDEFVKGAHRPTLSSR